MGTWAGRVVQVDQQKGLLFIGGALVPVADASLLTQLHPGESVILEVERRDGRAWITRIISQWQAEAP